MRHPLGENDLGDNMRGQRPRDLGQDKAADMAGAMPANVLLSDRAMVMAGLAKLVLAVNQ
jgi:hypothetical protein